MNKRIKKLFSLGICIALLTPAAADAAPKKLPVEGVWEDWDYSGAYRIRRDFGLVEKKVSNVMMVGGDTAVRLYIQKRRKKQISEVQLFKKEHGNYQKTSIVKNCKRFFPSLEGYFYVNSKNHLIMTDSGLNQCHFQENHTSPRDCLYSCRRREKEKILSGINAKKCWASQGMVAYVKNNSLYVIGSPTEEGKKCYEYEKKRQGRRFFQGKGNQIKSVVGCCLVFDKSTDSVEARSIFVLMKDGSLWGMGSNRTKLIANSKKNFYGQFVEVIPSGVKQISVGNTNIAMVKKNGDLYLWGAKEKSLKYHFGYLYLNKMKFYSGPKKIASGVKEVSVSVLSEDADYFNILYLKKDGTAYGRGKNVGCVFTRNYKKGWHIKPVKLMENVKHVYASPTMSLLLKKNGNLYWTGKQNYALWMLDLD